MRTLNWLWRGLLFFVLFAFALNNQHTVDLKWFLGYQWQAPMVFIVRVQMGEPVAEVSRLTDGLVAAPPPRKR